MEYKEGLDTDVVANLATRRRFPTRIIEYITSSASGAGAAIEFDNIAIIDKLIALSIYKSAPSSNCFNKAAARTILHEDRTGACLIECGLNAVEVVQLLGIAIKYSYSAKDKCDMKAYWSNLDQYVPWQSLTKPLSRFPSAKRKSIFRDFGRKICSLSPAAQVRTKHIISIF
jgi:hypothetical protein